MMSGLYGNIDRILLLILQVLFYLPVCRVHAGNSAWNETHSSLESNEEWSDNGSGGGGLTYAWHIRQAMCQIDYLSIGICLTTNAELPSNTACIISENHQSNRDYWHGIYYKSQS